MVQLTLPPSFKLLGFRVDPSRNVVEAPDGERALEPKVMQVLCALAGRAGSVVTRDELITEVWSKSFGADESLTRAVSLLRRTFDTRDGPALIETVPKRGYRLAAAVEPILEVPTTASSRRWASIIVFALIALTGAIAILGVRTQTKTRVPSHATAAVSTASGVVVVLKQGIPAGASPAATRIGNAVGRQVTLGLARASLLRVVDPSALSKPVADGMTFSVEQTTTDRVGSLRIGVTIRELAGGRLLWAQDFDRTLPLDTAGQDALGQAVTAELTNRLLVAAKAAIHRRPFASLRPWELTLLATWVPGSDEVFLEPHRPDRFLPQRRALSLDPDYGPAYAVWASQLSYDALFTADAASAGWRREAARRAEQALAHAPYDPDVLYAVATFYRQVGDRDRAVATLDRVLALQPDHPLAALDRVYVRGLCTPAAPAAVKMLEARLAGMSGDHPIRWVVLSHLADLYLASGDAVRAASAAVRSRAIVQSTWNGFALAVSQAASGDRPGAQATSREIRMEWPTLDYGRFAARSLPAWCLGGPDQEPMRAALTRAARSGPG